MASDKRWHEQLDYSCALQKAIEYHCRGKEVPPKIGKKCPHHARLLGKCKGVEGDKSYADTLKGCETESEVITELVQRVIALEDDMEKLRGAVISDAVRLNAHAEDITEHAHCLETLEQEHTKLSRHLGKMAGLWNSADVSLAHRIEELEEKQCNLYADRVFAVNGLAQRINTLAENEEFLAERLLSQKRRIEQLERLLEKGGLSMSYDPSFVSDARDFVDEQLDKREPSRRRVEFHNASRVLTLHLYDNSNGNRELRRVVCCTRGDPLKSPRVYYDITNASLLRLMAVSYSYAARVSTGKED